MIWINWHALCSCCCATSRRSLNSWCSILMLTESTKWSAALTVTNQLLDYSHLLFQISFLSSSNYVDLLSDPLYNQPVSWQKSLLTETAVSARRLLRVYSGTAVITCTLWIIFPILYYSQGLPVEFPFWTNLDHRKPVLWVSVLL